MDTDPLSDGQLSALKNLSLKSGGALTAFINIADARQLTELGLAVRSRQGWDITAAGAAWLKRLGADGAPAAESAAPLPFSPPGH
jgi:hypothetical protein